MSYAEHFSKHLRLAVLRLLNEAPACRANSSIIHSAVHHLGLSASRDQVRTELVWLREQGLVTLQEMGDLFVATATERGVEAAEGRASVPGVQRPTPKG